jgi:drug/metabolite transporter (DMT)-like permease
MASLFALLAAVFYGAADFLGGITTRRATMIGAVLVTQAAGLAVLLLATPLLPDADLSRADVIFGALGGITGSIGVGLLYLALAIGPMSVVAPVTAVCAAIVPLGVGLMLGERPHPWAALGALLALIAVALLSQTEANEAPPRSSEYAGRSSASLGQRHLAPPPAGRDVLKAARLSGDGIPASKTSSVQSGAPPGRLDRGVRVALVSGIAIGLFFVALAQTTADAVMWPLAISRVVSLTMFLALAVATGRPAGVPRAAVTPALACGALDMLANALYLVAVRQGQLGLVATLASLYPASTVLLARVVLGERLGAWQQVGVAGAVGAIVLIVGNS